MSPANVRTRRKQQSFSFACRVLLLASLPDLKTMGCADATIGNADPTEFDKKTIGSMPVLNSAPGIYAGTLTIDD